jgi:signal transduction histidine kinase/CheY-like chemotaxis protein
MTKKVPKRGIWKQLEAARKRLEDDDINVGAARAESMRATAHVGASQQPLRRILVVDDDEGFRYGIKAEAKKMQTGTEGQLPFFVEAMDASTAQEVINAIEAAQKAGQPFDVLLLDYELRGDRFTAQEVLAALNASANPVVKFLPRLAITAHWSKGESLTSMLLGLGADGVHLHKGHVTSPTEAVTKTNFQQILDTLQVSEFFEMRSRAWGRMWRTARHRIEREIGLQRLQPCSDEATYRSRLSQVWQVVFELMTKSGYASRANLRIFVDGQLQSINPVDEGLTRSGLSLMAWDHLPYVKSWLETANAAWQNDIEQLVPKFSTYCRAEVSSVDLGSERRLDDLLLGHRLIGMPLFTHHGPIGLFTLVRKPDATPFALTDWEQMLTVGLRLALHAQELRQRWLDHDRQRALVVLSSELDQSATEEEMLGRANMVIHNSMFQHVQGLRGTARLPPPAGLDPGGRTTVRMLLPDGKTTGFGVGHGLRSHDAIQALVHDPRDQKAWLVQRCIAEMAPVFHADTSSITEYAPSSPNVNRSLMLVPLKVSGAGVGALAVGHKEVKYFGENRAESADFEFLQRCAELLSQALQQQRESRLVRDVLDLLLDLSDPASGTIDPELRLPEKVAVMLARHLVACRAVVWMRPSASKLQPWSVHAAWDAMTTEAARLVPADKNRVVAWNSHLSAKWQESFTARCIDSSPLVNFTDKDFLQDNALGVNTASQLNLRVAMSRDGPTLAMMILLFTVDRPFDLNQNSDFLQRLARLCALFVQDRDQLQQLSAAISVANRNKGLADAYAQMRHQLRTQLGSVDESFKRCLRDLMSVQTEPIVVSSIKELHARWLENLPGLHQGLDASALFTREPNSVWFDLTELFEELKTAPFDRARHLGVSIAFNSIASIQVNADRDIIRIVLANLIDNSLDEFSMALTGASGRPKRHRDASPPKIEIDFITHSEFCEISVIDNGPGVAQSMISKLFTGVSNKPKGGGFQLRFSQERLRDLGMDLAYESNDSVGSRFKIQMPLDKVQNSSAK